MTKVKPKPLNEVIFPMQMLRERIDVIDKEVKRIDHSRGCPLNLEKELEKVNIVLQPLYFFDKYPKLVILLILGFVTLLALGIDNVFKFIMK